MLELKIISCTSKTSKDGKTYFMVGLITDEGNIFQLYSANPLNVGEYATCKVVSRVFGNVSVPTLAIVNEVF